jgi:hypothetical protein
MRRPLVAFLVLFSVLFAQLAVAAYACPGAATMAAASSSMVDMPDCDGSPQSQRDPLCAAHCQQNDQSRDTPSASLPTAAPFPIRPLVLAVRDDAGERARPLGFALERRIDPPASIRHCRLHI